MIQALVGRKIDQTQKFLQNGRRIPVTEIAVPDNAVVQVKTEEKDGYKALQLGFGVKKRPIKAVLGHAKKANLTHSPEKIQEVLLTDVDAADLPKPGDLLTVETVFKAGDIVSITGTSKGKGFAGVVKRHHFKGGPKTHGQSDRHRAPGSIGQSTTPGRVFKGKRMAGRMGHEQVTIKNLTVVDVDSENKKLFIQGLVPGHKNALLFITRDGENKKFVPLLSSKDDKKETEEAPQGTKLKAEERTEEVTEKASVKEQTEEAKETLAKTTEDESSNTEPEEKGEQKENKDSKETEGVKEEK